MTPINHLARRLCDLACDLDHLRTVPFEESDAALVHRLCLLNARSDEYARTFALLDDALDGYRALLPARNTCNVKEPR